MQQWLLAIGSHCEHYGTGTPWTLSMQNGISQFACFAFGQQQTGHASSKELVLANFWSFRTRVKFQMRVRILAISNTPHRSIIKNNF